MLLFCGLDVDLAALDLARRRDSETMHVSVTVEADLKENASISGAEVSCQAEVGLPCFHGWWAVWLLRWAGRIEQVEHAVEIWMEHSQ